MTVYIMLELMRQPLYNRSVEYADNRISLFSSQWGKCAVTGKEFMCTADIHCHHKIPKSKGGKDEYKNLILILEPVLKLIHAVTQEAIQKYKQICNLGTEQIKKVNNLRNLIGNAKIV